MITDRVAYSPSPPAGPSWYQSARVWAIAAVLALLAVVGAAAAVLSFSAIRDLAVLCGFDLNLAWLLPITIDAGAAAATVVWLARTLAPDDARRFACGLALTLLLLSVAANSVGHYLVAEHESPNIVIVVAVSAIAPATLGAVVHLAVLARRAPDQLVRTDVDAPVRTGTRTPPPAPTRVDEEDGDGYTAAARTEAELLGVALEKAPPGEGRKARRQRLARVRAKLARARARADRPVDNPGESAPVRALVSRH